MHNIVCFVDLSPESAAAARLARSIAATHGAHLVLVHPTRPPLLAATVHGDLTIAPTTIAGVAEHRHHEAVTAELSELAETIAGDGSVEITTTVLYDMSTEGWLELIDEGGFDLVVVGAARAGLLSRLVHHTPPERLARRARRPVLVLAGSTKDIDALDHLLVAVDYTDHCRVAAQLASDVVGPDGALSFVHIWDVPEALAPDGRVESTGDSPQPSALQLSHAVERGRLRDFVSSLSLRQASVDIHVAIGQPAEQIARRAEALAVDAIVVGSHRHDGWDDRLFGTVADRLIERSTTPVLAVPADARALAPVEYRSTIDSALADSFPASDPPSWWAGGSGDTN